jgi:glutathione S-transferase
MGLTFYERVGFEGRRPSPFSWRIRYALAHKGIDFEVHPVRFVDVDIIRRLSGQHLTPIIDDNGKVTHETWDIATYLEDRFPDRPSLFESSAGKGMAKLINVWADTQLARLARFVIYADFPAVLDPSDRAYFRSTRERDLGMTLEDACADQASKLAAFQQACVPLERTLAAQPFVCGGTPAYADYVVFSVFQWARLGSPKEIVPAGSSLAQWRERMISLHDNLADRFPAYPPKGLGQA